MCLAQDHNAVMPERLEPADARSRVKHSTTEPLRSLLKGLLPVYKQICLHHPTVWSPFVIFIFFSFFQPDDVVNVAVDKINGLLESFMGINDTDLCKYLLRNYGTPTMSEDYTCPCLSISTVLEPYLSICCSDFMHFWYK